MSLIRGWDLSTDGGPCTPGDPSRVEVVAAGATEILAHLPDVVTVHETGGRCLYASPSLEGLTGFTPQELVGHVPQELDLIHPDDITQIREEQARLRMQGGTARVMYRLRRRDDTFLWVESVGQALGTPDGTRFVISTREASDLHSLLRGLEHERALAEQLEELAAQKQAFITAVAHRMRTPLTVALGYADLLEGVGSELDEDRRVQMAGRLAQAVRQLRDLMLEATDLERLTRSDAVVDRRPVRIRPVCEEVIAGLTASERIVTIDVPQEMEVLADRSMLATALEVLLSNAFEHTPTGTRVRVSAEPTASGCAIAVEDDGPGVPVEARERIFEPFERGDADDPNPRVGLGLHLVARIAALHGGRSWVQGNAAGGATFFLDLPAGLPPTPGTPSPVAGGAAQEQETGIHQVGTGAAVANLSRESAGLVSSLLRTLRDNLDMQVAYLSVFIGDEQIIIATEGDGEPLGIRRGRRVALAESYCLRMVDGEVGPIVADTSLEPSLVNLPATAGGIASYVGVPVHLPNGHLLGSLCCADSQPHDELPPGAPTTLMALSRLLIDQLGSPSVSQHDMVAMSGRIGDVLATPGAPRIVYQPIVDLDERRVAGLEALSRFSDGRPVDLWFSEAARVGLLRELEEKAVRQALPALNDTRSDCYLSLNFSPQTIIGGDLEELLADVPLDRIVVEVTEHAAVEDYEELIEVLRPLRDRGLRLAIDDVGNGFASLRHVMLLRPDIVKMDRSLTKDADHDAVQRAIATALREVTTELGAQLVAEGIEDVGCLQALRAAGVTHAQGWLLAEPLETIVCDLPDHVRRALLPGARYDAGP